MPESSQVPTTSRIPDLAVRQVAAIDAFNRARALAEAAVASTTASREARLDAARRLDVVRRQHAALVERTRASFDLSHELLTGCGPRAVVVHRDPWFTDRVCGALVTQGFTVVAQLDNGADAVGAVVAEQPDLLLLGDPVPMMTGTGVVQEVLRWSPQTFVAVQAGDPRSREALVAAGVGSVFSRSVPPHDVASGLADALTARRSQSLTGQSVTGQSDTGQSDTGQARTRQLVG